MVCLRLKISNSTGTDNEKSNQNEKQKGYYLEKKQNSEFTVYNSYCHQHIKERVINSRLVIKAGRKSSYWFESSGYKENKDFFIFFLITFLLFTIFISLGAQDPGSFEQCASIRWRRCNTIIKTLRRIIIILPTAEELMSFNGNKGRGVDQGFHILAIKLLKMQRSARTGYHTPGTSSALVQSYGYPCSPRPNKEEIQWRNSKD